MSEVCPRLVSEVYPRVHEAIPLPLALSPTALPKERHSRSLAFSPARGRLRTRRQRSASSLQVGGPKAFFFRWFLPCPS